MLSEKIVHAIVKMLCDKVKEPSENDVECLTHLLQTVGEQLDHPRAKKFMDKYFERMALMRGEPTISSRHRFLIDELADLRRNGWKRRKLRGLRRQIQFQ